MRNRLLISLALAVLVAVLTAGVVSAQTATVNDGGAVSVDLPDGTTVTTPEVLPACSNSADDDGDGLVDLDDTGCTDALDTDETDAAPPPSTTTPEPPVAPPAAPPTDAAGDAQSHGFGPADGSKQGADDSTGFVPAHDNSGDKNGNGKDGKQGGRDHGFGEPDSKGSQNDDQTAGFDKPEIRRPDGTPTTTNPTLSLTDVGPAPVGVPNFIIDQFSIPPFLLPIYQACGTQYGIPWEVLASINRIETAFGTNLNVSTAGALGWMQFIPSSWQMYGVDANSDGRKDPYNPVDAICAAARYLKAAGGQEDISGAIFAYNHADWYVDEVLLYARQYGNLPSGLVDSLTGLTEGAHFPVAAKARYADDISERAAAKRATPTKGSAGNVADVISDSPTRRGINIFAKKESPVVAVNDGVIEDVGKNKRLGRYVVLRDAFGNEFTFAGLGSISDVVPVPKERKLSAKDFDLITPGEGDHKPTVEASDTGQADAAGASSESESADQKKVADRQPAAADRAGPANTEDSRDRLYALPRRRANIDRADLTGQLDAVLGKGMPGYETFKSYFSGVLRFDDSKMDTEPLRKGSHVVAGTILGRVAPSEDGVASHLNFAITPAGRGAHTIDPKPILDGWKLLEATAIYRAAGKDPFDNEATVGQVLLASKAQLQEQVLNDPNLEIYSCGREDIQAGLIDRRILATMEYLVQRGFRLTITSLECGHGVYTTSGNVSEHTTGDAMDIALVNGIPILGNQGTGS
ncbi:MAG: lytic murein transglycosylase, partial [Solirubrobacterales bacterium]